MYYSLCVQEFKNDVYEIGNTKALDEEDVVGNSVFSYEIGHKVPGMATNIDMRMDKAPRRLW